MGKKGSWFSAIKRVFIPNSKEKLANGSEKKSTKEKKKGRGILRHGENKSFIPLFREPSSIEKILGDAEQEKILVRPSTPAEQPQTPPLVPPGAASPWAASPRAATPRATSPRAVSPRAVSPRAVSPRAASPRVASPRVQKHKEIKYRPEPTLRNHNLSATKIQAAYRGYMARRSFRALRGLVRLQGVVRSQNVKRQTTSAMKYMQLLVRVQNQIQSRRIQMLENQALQRQSYKNDKEMEGSLGKWTMSQMSEAGHNEDWDDSLLTKEQIEARMQRKVEAVMKRERAMAFAYSHQLWKANPRSAQTALLDVRSGGFPWWWNWLERQLPPANASESQAMKNVHPTPPRSTLEPKPSPRPPSSNYKQQNFGFDNLESVTPRSTRSMVPVRTRHPYTPSNRTPPPSGSSGMKHSRSRMSPANSTFDAPLKDDDSLMSCPPFSVPNYMVPTVSAKAKVRTNSNPKERFPVTPGSETSKRRFSFPLTPTVGSFKWNKESGKDPASQRVLEKHESLHSIGDLSVDSTISMPAAVGRRPFNRFV
ncbi:protein IQ-DOMAIN 14 [Cornus florida]|uniref:protein IQ-DOMAIN 14 n=1 Tax=Cornus florida TaxID=4283 RepID=UPI0028991F18|nr:protein IQ-DOMAIN 14 [Cornus florida]XP_059655205.1 protein IQ-DOMAIN 14 [Cornus florida]